MNASRIMRGSKRTKGPVQDSKHKRTEIGLHNELFVDDDLDSGVSDLDDVGMD